MRFSLILASRQRFSLLTGLLASLMETTKFPEMIEVLIVVDSDDTYPTHEMESMYDKINLRFFVRERSEWMHRDYINWVYKKSSGKYIIILNDDTKFMSNGWDEAGWEKLENYLADKNDGVVYGSTENYTGPTLCTFPLFSRKAADAVGFLLPNERKNWGADHDARLIYEHPSVNRKLDLPEIGIQHVSHYTGLVPRDGVSFEVEKSFMTQHNVYVPLNDYIEKLSNYISTHASSKRGKVLVVYNICGIAGTENLDYYTASINSILNQEFSEGFHVVISSCRSSQKVMDTITSSFGNLVSYNWIDDTLPLMVTFNQTVQLCVREFGPFESYLYVDSGVTLSTRRDVISVLVDVMRSNNYGMVATQVDVDTGYKNWKIAIKGSDYVLSVGQACNLHCQLFSHSIYEAYGEKILPDIFAHHTSESTYSFINAAIGKRWVISSAVSLHHETSMDGPSSGFLHRELLFKSPKTIYEICSEGHPYGFGYEECGKICMHDHSKFDATGTSLDPNLYAFIKENLYLSKSSFDYRTINHTFIPSRKPTAVSLKSPQISCILVSHNKPEYVKEAIQSVLDQTFHDWEMILFDSGDLASQGFFDYLKDPRITVLTTNEDATLRAAKSMAPWCFNEAFRRGLLNGFFVTYLCDDDIFYANAFETFVMFYKNNPNVQAMYASQDTVIHYPDGTKLFSGDRRALVKRGSCVGGEPLDCQVDYLQFCHRKDLLNTVLWPEDKNVETHADGVFMDKIGSMFPVYPIDIKVSQNRRTPQSTYNPVR